MHRHVIISNCASSSAIAVSMLALAPTKSVFRYNVSLFVNQVLCDLQMTLLGTQNQRSNTQCMDSHAVISNHVTSSSTTASMLALVHTKLVFLFHVSPFVNQALCDLEMTIPETRDQRSITQCIVMCFAISK